MAVRLSRFIWLDFHIEPEDVVTNSDAISDGETRRKVSYKECRSK